MLGALVVGAHRHAGEGRRHRDAGRRADRDPHERRACSRRCSRCASFLFEAVYENAIATAEFKKATGILGGLWEKVRERPDEFLDRRTIETEGLDAAARDFIAGMTDRYAVRLFEQLFIPKPWVGSTEPGAVSDQSTESACRAESALRQMVYWAVHAALNLTQDPDSRTSSSSRTFQPEAVRRATDDATGSSRRSRWRSTSTRTRSSSGSSGRVQTTLELPCSRCLEPFRCRSTPTFDLRYQPRAENAGEGEREIEEDDLDDRVLRGRRDRPRRADARAVLPGAADEAAVPRRLQGAVPDVRDEPEHAARATARRDWEDPRLAALKAI